jgi:hypothetical protein
MEQKTRIKLADILSTFIPFVDVGVQIDVGDEAVENRTGCLNHAIRKLWVDTDGMPGGWLTTI